MKMKEYNKERLKMAIPFYGLYKVSKVSRDESFRDDNPTGLLGWAVYHSLLISGTVIGAIQGIEYLVN